MAKFNFNLRNPGKLSVCPIYLVIRFEGMKLVYPTGETIEPKYWQGEKLKRGYQRAIENRKFPEYPEFNARLDYMESKFKTIFRRFQNDNDGKSPSVEELRVLLNVEFKGGWDNRNMTLFNFIERYINQSEQRFNTSTGQLVAKATVQAYRNTERLLKEYKEYSFSRVDFDTIDLEFYDDFLIFLSEEKEFSPNTIGKHIKILKTFLNDATEKRFNSNLDFRSKRFKIPSEESDAIYLSKSELQEMYDLDLSDNPRLDKVRDLFLVGCWTGLRFSDFSQIKEEHIGEEFIEIITQKTNEKVIIPIYPTVRSILNKYSTLENGLPPAISNAKMNKYLKEVCQLIPCLLKKEPISKTRKGKRITTRSEKYKLVTTHTARRSFATNLYKDGFPSISIMKITGHRTERAFLTYIKITPNDNAKLLQLHWQKNPSMSVG